MALQKVTSYFDTLRSSETFGESYFEELLEKIKVSRYDELTTETFGNVLSEIGNRSLSSLTKEQIDDIKNMLKSNSVDGEVDPIIWRKCFRYWLRNDITPKSVLLVIDVQNDFITGSLALKNCPLGEDGAEVVPLINKERQHFENVIFTKDWHPANHCSFASNCKQYCLHHTSPCLADDTPSIMSSVVYDVNGKAIDQILWPEHCIQNSHGAELHKDLQVEESDGVLVKGTTPAVDSYSGFWDNGSLVQTDLFTRLIDNNITTVFCCGLAFDYCVGFTAQHASMHGFDTYVVKDLCRCISELGKKDMEEKFRQQNVKEINSNQIEATLKDTKCKK